MAGLGPKVTLTFAGEDNLSKSIAALEAKTAALEAKINSLGSHVDALKAKNVALAEGVGKASKSVDELGSKDREVSSLREQFEKMGPAIAGISRGASLLAALGAGINVVGGVVGAVTALSGAALLVPGAALAGAAAMNTFKLATAGFGDAMKAGLAGDTAKFAEATSKMAPEMAAAARSVAALKPQVDGLKRAVQGNFWGEFSGEITRVGNTLLPVLHDGLGNIAQDMGGVAFSALSAMRTPFFTGAVGSILESTAGFFREINLAAGNVLTGIVGIGQVGATYLPQLGEGIGGVAMRFRQWVTSVGGQNQIKAWIEQGIAAFGQLKAIVVNIGSTLGAVFTGLGGQVENPLGRIADLTAKIAAFASSQEGQQAFAALGTAAQAAGLLMSGTLLAAIEALAPVIVALAPLVTSIATTMAQWSPVLGPAVVAIYGLSKAFQGIQVGIGIYEGAMALAKSETLIAVATTVGGWIAMAAGAMARAVVMAAAWVVAMGPIGWAIAAVVALAAIIFMNWDTISAYTAQIWTAITGWISSAWTSITTGVSSAVSAVVGFLSALPGQVLGFLMQLPMMAASALGTLAGYVYLGAVAAWDFLWNTLPAAISAAATWLAGLPGQIGGWLSSLGSTVAGIASSAWSSFVSTSISVGSAVLSFVASIPGRVGSFLSALPGILMSAATAAWNGFRNACVSGANAVMSFISGLPGRIMGFFSGAGSWLVNAGANIVNGLINGIRNAAQAVLDYIARLGQQIADSFRAAVGIHSPSKVFAELGVNIGAGLVVGMQDSTPAAVGASTGMATGVTDAARAALAAPTAGSARGGRGASGGAQVTFTGNTSDALATVIMGMVRQGKIQIKAA